MSNLVKRNTKETQAPFLTVGVPKVSHLNQHLPAGSDEVPCSECIGISNIIRSNPIKMIFQVFEMYLPIAIGLNTKFYYRDPL